MRKIKKTPIVVNDSRGFYTSRCFGTYTREGLVMMGEGIAPALIENVGRMSGMPMGPLEVTDSVGVDTGAQDHARDPQGSSEQREARRQPRRSSPGSSRPRTAPAGRPARASTITTPRESARACGRAVRLRRRKPGSTDADPEELKLRLLTIQALEAARCFEEGVITDPRDADVGAILGWGFAPYTGGPISMIDTMGAAAFVERCEAPRQETWRAVCPEQASARAGGQG